MPCNTCDKVTDPSNGMDYRWAGGNTTFTASNGTVVTLHQPLIRATASPRHGWAVVFWINGQRTAVEGTGPQEVFRKTERLFQLSNITLLRNDVWLNLNIQWLSRTLEKNRLIPLERLLELAESLPDPEGGPHSVPRWNPAEWGGRVWDFAALYLAGETYDRHFFLLMMEQVLGLLSPTDNPTLGNGEAYIILTGRVSDLTKEPRYTVTEAREWLLQTMRILGLKMGAKHASMEAAVRNHHWKP